ncbi:hypothetical protein [Aestuariirhabdus sp. LZHN29]|uniref:hypothetical protein n=1 Tax=Aestuariirhabdus sp. LZHN29 TaxID=3417462 RepID=UPI003CF26D8D
MNKLSISITVAAILMASTTATADSLNSSIHPMLNLSEMPEMVNMTQLSDPSPTSISLNPNTGLSLEYTTIDSDYDVQDELLGEIMQLRLKLVATF